MVYTMFQAHIMHFTIINLYNAHNNTILPTLQMKKPEHRIFK